MYHNLATKAVGTSLEAEQAKAALSTREWNRQEPLTVIKYRQSHVLFPVIQFDTDLRCLRMLPYIHEGFFADAQEPEAHFRGQPASSFFETQLQVDRSICKDFLSKERQRGCRVFVLEGFTGQGPHRTSDVREALAGNLTHAAQPLPGMLRVFKIFLCWNAMAIAIAHFPPDAGRHLQRLSFGIHLRQPLCSLVDHRYGSPPIAHHGTIRRAA